MSVDWPNRVLAGDRAQVMDTPHTGGGEREKKLVDITGNQVSGVGESLQNNSARFLLKLVIQACKDGAKIQAELRKACVEFGQRESIC